MPSQIEPSRKLASYFLVGAIGLLALNHWRFLDTGRFYPIVVYGAPLFGLLALGSLINPNLLLALEGRDDPAQLRVLAILLAVVGLACGFLLHKTIYGLSTRPSAKMFYKCSARSAALCHFVWWHS